MEQNFYELLGVDFHASSFEVTLAYKENYQLYQEDSVVSYSFFSREERGEILARLDQAYSTLINEEKRSQYDQSLIECGILKEEKQFRYDRETFRPVFNSKHPTNNTILTIREELKTRVSSSPVIQEILTYSVLWGKDLKRIREELGMSLETIAEMTKVRIVFLRALEDDEFEKAPSRMFLKSFLKSYADSIGLDADFVASRYIR